MKFRSSIKNIEEFITGSIWHDFKIELNIWLENVRDCLEDGDNILSIESVKKLQGNAEAIRNCLNLPETVIESIMIENEKKEGK
jgi:hypothetical protein